MWQLIIFSLAEFIMATPLIEAAMNGKQTEVERLIAEGGSPFGFFSFFSFRVRFFCVRLWRLLAALFHALRQALISMPARRAA